MKIGRFALLAALVSSLVVVSCSDETVKSDGKGEDGSSETNGNGENSGGENSGGEGGETQEPEVKAGEYGSSCESEQACNEGLKCIDGKCGRKDGLAVPCSEEAACVVGVCLDGACRTVVEEDGTCDGIYLVCGEGMSCEEVFQKKYCARALDAGEDCVTGSGVCGAGLTCDMIEGVCIHYGEAGEVCDGAFNQCIDILQCRSGYCRETAPEGAACDAETKPCESLTAVCYDNKCIESSSCESDSDCLADTYCCTEEACKLKGVCLPYGEGPREVVNESCSYETVPGLFEADIQCEWLKPDKTDKYPNHYNLVVLPLVAKTPHDMGTSNAILALTYHIGSKGANGIDQDDPYDPSVIRILNGETCELVETIAVENNLLNGGVPLAVADVDNDGNVEIFGQRARAYGDGYVAFHWDAAQHKYVLWWNSVGHKRTQNQHGIAIHDINDDGIPEVITAYAEVFDSLTGKKMDKSTHDVGIFSTIGDLDGDGKVELVGKKVVYRWDTAQSDWVVAYKDLPMTSSSRNFIAYGDFGTAGATAADFDWEHLDGVAEIVGAAGASSTDGYIQITTLSGQNVFAQSGFFGGGAPTIGDFDGDGLPEAAVAYGDAYTIFDPRCLLGVGTCENSAKGVLWTRKSQDVSSYATGSSLFDFEGDGATEAVYADECYTRVYDGKTGDVLFSARHNSRTWYEMPIIVDVDNDESAEIIMGANQTMSCENTDPVHRGLRCEKDSDCTSKNCVKGLCRCTSDAQCNWRKDGNGNLLKEYGCVNPLTAADKTESGDKVCRAIRSNSDRTTGIRVMRDRFDRWASSRNIWNQQSYNITNINDDQTIPKTSEWVKKQNFLIPGLNNYRANSQGLVGKNAAPDITGKLNKDDLCKKNGDTGGITLTGKICNRGTKMVASKMPASFYRVNEDGSLGEKYCTAYTAANVPVGGCMDVSCTMSEIVEGIRVRMISNDDGDGGRTTVECNDQNNWDEIVLEACQIL